MPTTGFFFFQTATESKTKDTTSSCHCKDKIPAHAPAFRCHKILFMNKNVKSCHVSSVHSRKMTCNVQLNSVLHVLALKTTGRKTTRTGRRNWTLHFFFFKSAFFTQHIWFKSRTVIKAWSAISARAWHSLYSEAQPPEVADSAPTGPTRWHGTSNITYHPFMSCRCGASSCYTTVQWPKQVWKAVQHCLSDKVKVDQKHRQPGCVPKYEQRCIFTVSAWLNSFLTKGSTCINKWWF